MENVFVLSPHWLQRRRLLPALDLPLKHVRAGYPRCDGRPAVIPHCHASAVYRTSALKAVALGSYIVITYRDPAERSGNLRFFYRDWRPTRLGRLWNRATAWLCGLGVLPDILVTLVVKGRQSGRLRTNVLVATRYEGQRYLVSMLGEGSDWVRNVRAAGGAAFIKRGRTLPVLLTDIAPDKRAPILKAFCRVATSGRHHIPVPPDGPVSAFEAVAKDYPVFRIDPVS